MHEIGVSVIWLSLQVSVVAVVCAVLYFLVRRQGPLLRSLVISSSMLIALLLTALVFSPWPRWSSEKTEQPNMVEPQVIAMVEDRHPTQNSNTPVSRVAANNLESVWSSAWGGFLEGLKKAPPVKDQVESISWPTIIGFLFLGGVALGVMRLCFGYILLQREVQRSISLEGTAAQDVLDDILTKQNNQSLIHLQETRWLGTAAVVGWWRPVILLPDTWRTWSANQLQAVLMHEIAHINHRDLLSNLCAEIARSVYFYHPLMHWLAGRLRLEQELAADAAAAESTGGAEPYLVILAAMAMAQSKRSVLNPARAFLPTQSTFLRRIDMLKEKTPFKGAISRSARVGAISTMMLAGMIAIGIRGDQDSIAQDATSSTQDSSEPVAAVGEIENKRPQKFPIDFVPHDALAVFAIRPAKILAQNSMKPIRKLIDQENQRTKRFQILGFQLEQIETTTLILLGSNMNQQNMGGIGPNNTEYVCMIKVNQGIKLTDEINLTNILKNFSRGKGKRIKSMSAKINGETILKVLSEKNEPLVILDDHTLLVATSENSLQQVIDTMERGGTAHWAKQWKPIEQDTVATILNVRQVRELVWKKQLNLEVKDSTAWGFIYPIWESTDLISLGVMIDGTLSFKSTLYQVQNGTKIKKTLEAPLILVENMLAMSKQNMNQNKRKEETQLNLLVNICEQLVKTVDIQQNGENVTLKASLNRFSVGQAVTGLLPALKQAGAATLRAEGRNNLKRIMLALHAYHDANKHFPPPILMGADGKTPHSWRVELLPYLGEKALYDEYNLDEPWDSKNNKKVLAKMPAVFRNPADEGAPYNTSYFAVIGRNTAFGKVVASNQSGAGIGGFDSGDIAGGDLGGKDGRKVVLRHKGGVRIRDITDGLSNTIAVVEAKHNIPWTKPEDIQYDGKKLPKFGGFHQGGYLVGLCDGTVKFISENLAPKTLKKLLEINDGQPLP